MHFLSVGDVRLYVVTRNAGSQETRSKEISGQFTCKLDSFHVAIKDKYSFEKYYFDKHFF